MLSKFFYLIHVDSTRRIYIDLNVSKKFDLNVMMYHVKKFVNWNEKDYSSRKTIESILFLSRLLSDAEIKYWFTELKLNDIIWILRKIRHLFDFFLTKSFVMFIDHETALKIVKQINMTIVSIDKFNFRLVRTSDYIQRFELKIRHKFDKQHIVLDALFRLVNTNIDVASTDENELNVFFIIAFVQMKKNFRRKFIANYTTDFNWKKISDVLNKQITENNARLSFYRENDFIFRSNEIIFDDHAFEFRRLCISATVISDILTTIHDESHAEFARCYEKITSFYYIRDLSRYLRDFLKHCFKCQIFQTRRHRFYDSFQFIFTSSISFHTITIDFILTLFSFFTTKKFDCLMSVSCKYSKRILLISEKIIWTTIQWKHALLDRLDTVDWKLSKIIISNRDKKFLFDMWIAMFTKLNVKLLYFIVYHSQTNDLSKRINQTLEIILRFLINTLKHSNRWFEILSRFQRDFNNAIISVDKFFNEIVYDFTSVQTLNLPFLQSMTDDLSLKKRRLIIKHEIIDVIAFEQMNAKFHYDRKHQSLYIKPSDYAFIQFHKEYNIFSTINKKIDQQYVDLFLIIEKMSNLIYRLAIPDNWRINLIFSVTQLKICPTSDDDFYHKSKSNHSNSMYVERDTLIVKFFEIERFINKRKIAKRESEYLMRWKSYDSEHDVWRNLSKLNNAMNLIWKYENVIDKTVTLFDRRIDSVVVSKSLFKKQSFVVVISSKSMLRKSSADSSSSVFSTFEILIRKSVTILFEFNSLRRSSRLKKKK